MANLLEVFRYLSYFATSIGKEGLFGTNIDITVFHIFIFQTCDSIDLAFIMYQVISLSKETYFRI